MYRTAKNIFDDLINESIFKLFNSEMIIILMKII